MEEESSAYSSIPVSPRSGLGSSAKKLEEDLSLQSFATKSV